MATKQTESAQQRYRLAYCVTAAILAYYTVYCYLIDLVELSLTYFGSLMAISVNHLYWRWRKSSAFTYHTLLCLMLVIFAVAHHWDGKLLSMSLWLLPVVPMLAAYLIGMRASALYALGSMGLLGYVVALASPEDTIPEILDHPGQWITLRIATLCLFSLFGIVSSVTTRRRIWEYDQRKAQLQDSIATYQADQQAQSNFLATMSHEIRTPMNGIFGMTQVLTHDTLPPHVSIHVQTMHGCGQRLLCILTKILELSKIESDNPSRLRAQVSVDELLDQVVSNLRTKLGHALPQLHTANHAPDACITVDRQRLGHLLSILAENAVTHNPDTPVHLEFLRSSLGEQNREKRGIFVVRDLGAGICDEQKLRLQKHLSPSEQSSDNDVHGVGVGLTIAQELTRSLDVTLSFESSPNHGTEFCVQLPDAAQRSPGQELQSTSLDAAARRPNRMALSANAQVRRLRLLAYIPITLLALGYYVLQNFLYGHRIGLAINLISLTLVFISAFWNKKRPGTKGPAWTYLLSIHVVLGLSCLADGQIRSESLWLFPLVPIVASFLLGVEAALACTISGIVLIVANTWLHHHVTLQQEYAESILDYAVFRLIGLTVFSLVGIIASKISNRQVELLNQEGERLEIAKKLAVQASDYKTRFLQRMSHEIRTPMNGLLVAGEHLLSQDLPPKQLESVETIHRCGRHLLTLLDEVLDLDESVTMTEVPACEHFDLVQLLEDVTALFREKATLSGLKIGIHAQVPHLYCQGDPTRLLQIISNLVGNAIKFSDQGMITLRLKVTNLQDAKASCHDTLIEVQDQGIGISSEHQERIFEDFVQVNDGKQARGGTGLGLAISRSLARSLDGDLTVESSPGQGSTFTLALSLERGQKAASAAKVTATAPKAGPEFRMRVLVVDDNAINRTVAQAQLAQLKCEVECASDGLQAVHMASQTGYDVIFMDLRMPNMNGVEATRKIRGEQGPCRQSYIVALTADSYEEQRRACLDSGMNEHLSKPYTKQQLIDVLTSAQHAKASQSTKLQSA